MKQFKLMFLLILFGYLGDCISETKSNTKLTQNSFQRMHYGVVNSNRSTKRPRKEQKKKGKFKKKIWRVCCKRNKTKKIVCKHCLSKKTGWVFINEQIFNDLVLQYFEKMRKILASG